MLPITSRTRYGLAALFELTENYGKNLLQVNDIVHSKKIPKTYLEQILNRLQKSGIVKSVRGNKGGYELASHPDTITLMSVIESLDKIFVTDSSEIYSSLDEVLKKAENAVRKEFEVSLSFLVERQRILQQGIVFYI